MLRIARAAVALLLALATASLPHLHPDAFAEAARLFGLPETAPPGLLAAAMGLTAGAFWRQGDRAAPADAAPSLPPAELARLAARRVGGRRWRAASTR